MVPVWLTALLASGVALWLSFRSSRTEKDHATAEMLARTTQQLHRQWLLGKGIDGFCPMGPAIVTADEVPDPETAAECYAEELARAAQPEDHGLVQAHRPDEGHDRADVVFAREQVLPLPPALGR